MPITVLIVDDQALVRAGFRMILDAAPEVTVIGEAPDGAQAVQQARHLRPDVILMDIRMPEMNGIDATKAILAFPNNSSRVLVLTTFDEDEYIHEAIRAGASGFLLKDTPPEQLVDAIRVLASGEALLSPSVTRRVIASLAERPESKREVPAAMASLTAREREVFLLVARGLSNAEIAASLVVSETTVKTHVGHVLGKLGLRDRVQAVVLAYESGLVEPGQ